VLDMGRGRGIVENVESDVNGIGRAHDHDHGHLTRLAGVMVGNLGWVKGVVGRFERVN